jgi:hypothetical protein
MKEWLVAVEQEWKDNFTTAHDYFYRCTFMSTVIFGHFIILRTEKKVCWPTIIKE